MSSIAYVFNPFTGTLSPIRADSAFHLKDSVDTYNSLPTTGNTENDVRITEDTDKMYTWGIASSSGSLSDWKEIGSSSSVDWSAINNKPSSSVADIDDAVSKKHTQGTDQKLDEGGANEVVVADVKDAVDKKHEHSNKAQLDLITDGDHDVRTDNPHSVDKNDVGLGNVTNNSQIKKASSSTDDYLPKWIGTSGDELEDSSISETDASDAISKKHTQNTDEIIKVFDSVASISDTSGKGIQSVLMAGENLSFGDIGYIKSDGKVWKADADADTTMPAIVMALGTINADATGRFLHIGVVRDDTSWDWTVGATLYVDTTAGAITETAPSGSGDIVQVVGIAITADVIYFKPDLTIIELA